MTGLMPATCKPCLQVRTENSVVAIFATTGGTLPENLPKPEKSIKQIQKATTPKLGKGKKKDGKDAS